MNKATVFFVFRPGPEGREVATYAASLADRLRCGLCVLVPTGSISEEEASGLRLTISLMVTETISHERLIVGHPETYAFPPGAIVVDRRLASVRRDVTVLHPQMESAFARSADEDGRMPGPILVPLGNRDSSRNLLDKGLPVAQALRLPVVFYHTTYRQKGNGSPDPVDHLDPTARETINAAQSRASAMGIDSSVVVEMVERVAFGVAEAAHRHGCSLVLMPRATDRRGRGYPDDVMECAATPTLVIGKNGLGLASDSSPGISGSSTFAPPNLSPAPAAPSCRGFLWTSYGVMAVAVIQYLAKIVLKGAFGAWTGSAVFIGDAAHNGSDIFQAILVMVGIRLARRATSRDYPLGWRGLDTLWSFAIGLSLAYAAVVGVLVPSIVGLLGSAGIIALAETGGSRLLEGWNGVYAVLIMLASAGLSQLVGRYQVRVGRETGHASVVADGQETLSDGRIELLAAAGFVLQAVTQAPWVEHLLGLGMVYLMGGTAKEILTNAFEALVGRSLGEDTELRIRCAALRLCGVDGVTFLRTYRRGTSAVVEIDVATRLDPVAFDRLSRVLTEIVGALVEGEASVSVRVAERSVDDHRRAFLATLDGDGIPHIVADLHEATHVLVCETADGAIESWRPEPIGGRSLADLLRGKEVRVLLVPAAHQHVVDAICDRVGTAVRVDIVRFTRPEFLGLPLE